MQQTIAKTTSKDLLLDMCEFLKKLGLSQMRIADVVTQEDGTFVDHKRSKKLFLHSTTSLDIDKN